MSSPPTRKLSFQIEIRRVIEILSNDIYDSPYALLRENIQNAYDAILMRQEGSKDTCFEPIIDVTLNDASISIQDNGIGMDVDVISNNFWKAGSSGKNTEIAQRAGVVGTFGIGAMANFGVCETLKVVSHYYQGNETIETFAERDSLSVTEDCISFTSASEQREPGTTIFAELDEKQSLTIDGAKRYLAPYIQYVQIPIRINGELISQKNYFDIMESIQDVEFSSDVVELNKDGVSFNCAIYIEKNARVKLKISNINYQNTKALGEIVLVQGAGNIYGLRNYFGLAPIPVSSAFNFGGIANLSILHPTAGREALSQESISIITKIINILEEKVAVILSELDIADTNQLFMNYIVNRNRYDLAGKIRIDAKPFDEMIPLNKVSGITHDRKTYYYGGRDNQTILAFANENSCLLHLSQNNPRRRIQNQVLRQKGVEEVPDKPSIQRIVDRSELSLREASLLLRITRVLNEDYLLVDTKVFVAEITHQVPSMVENKNGTIEIYLSRESGAVQQVLETYETAYEIYGGFVKDFVRNYLYQKFANFVPSSTRQGAEALHKILMKSKELYKYEYTDLGNIDSLLSDYVSGKVDFPELLKKSTTIARTHSQTVNTNQVGNVEQEIPSIVEQKEDEQSNINLYGAIPPLDRTDTNTPSKILKTSKPYPQLNNFNMFLSVSDQVHRRKLDFFMQPHTTKIIWGMHRIVYVFTHASNDISLYYDIELKERLTNESAGGKAIPTTTIITQNRIFIPIIPELNDFFDIQEGSKAFYVRHDVITDFSRSL